MLRQNGATGLLSWVIQCPHWANGAPQWLIKYPGWGWAGSHKVTGKGYIQTENSQMTSTGSISTSTYHTKQLNPWPNSKASCVMNHSQLSACQGEMEPFEGDPSNHGHLTSLRNKPYLKQPGQLSGPTYLAELLANVYSHCLMMKSVSCCCVHGRRLFLDSITYNNNTEFTVNY